MPSKLAETTSVSTKQLQSVDFGILGPLRIAVDGRDASISAAKVRTFAALLLTLAPRPVPVASLIDELWEEDPPHSSVANIRTYAAQLRQALSPDRLATTECGYQLRVHPGELDRARADEQLAAAEAAVAQGRLTEAARLLGLARREWRGRPLEGVRLGPILDAERTALEDRYRLTTELYVRVHLAMGEHRAMLPLLRRYCAEHPLRESASELLILALYLGGDTAGALGAYADARNTLVAQLGIEPGTHLRALQQTVLRGDQVRVFAETTSKAHVPAPRRESAVATGAPWRVRPRELPRCPGNGAHRSVELTMIAEILADPQRRSADRSTVAVVSGGRGPAASTMALRAAHLVAPEFPDGQIYVNFAETSASSAPGRILRSLGVAPDQVPQDPAEAAARLRSVLFDLRVLMVLDQVSSTAQVLPVLPAGTGCAAVIASENDLDALDDACRVGLSHC